MVEEPDRATVTNAYHDRRDPTKCTMRMGGPDAYQTLPDPVLAVRNPLADLVWSTNCYHPPDLALLLPRDTFTNHYHRGEDITHSGRDYVLCGVIMYGD
jgi:hypothetical protein